MKNKSYPVEFKIKAVEMFKESGKSQEQVANELGVADSTLSKWLRQYNARALIVAKSPSNSDKEIMRLNVELRRKAMEVEILKKAMAFFAKENAEDMSLLKSMRLSTHF